MTTFPPTPEQSAIIDAIRRGESIIVNALAGAAKTSTIQMASTYAPTNSLALAFNKKIQVELAEKMPTSFKVQTINALGLSVWTKFVGRVPVDSSKMSKLLRKLDPKAPWHLTRIVSAAKLSGLVPAQRAHMGQGLLEDTRANWEDLADDCDLSLVHADPFKKEETDYFQLCQTMLIASIDESFKSGIDFDDQVYMPTCFGAPFPKFDCVFVDEAQDLSPLNHLMLRRLAPKQLVVVGDPLQSIYAFRGADTDSMPKLAADWQLKPYTLSICFRCSKEVVDLAKTWAPHMQSPDWAKEGAVSWLPDELSDNADGSWSLGDLPDQFTVICRNNAPLVKLALKIYKRRKIAFINNRAEAAMHSALRKICNYKKDLTMETIAGKIAGSLATKLELEDPKKHGKIIDEHDALQHCVDEAQAQGLNYEGLEQLISSLFQNKTPDVWFSTGHGSKGLEWENVLHLDPWLLPSKHAHSPEALQQEANIHYVITTRAKLNLFHADSKQFSKE